MSLYTVHVPQDAVDPANRADRTVFIREGFNRWAFVFGWFFLVWHRMWAAAIAWLLLLAILGGLSWRLTSSLDVSLAVLVLMHLLLGLEGNELRRWRLNGRQFSLADIVLGARHDEAEYAFFHRQPVAERTSSALPPRVVARDATPAVIGMFPDESGS